MKKFSIVPIVLLSFLLVACGGSATSNSNAVPVKGDHVTINSLNYPVYAGSMVENKLGVDFYTSEDSAEDVFAWYDEKMKAEGWTVTLDASNGKTGQMTYQKGDPNDLTSLEFVSVNIYQDGDKASVNITPLPNRYRK
ncbi:MAG: hypothetical protein Q8P68_04155 [Candidatus Peregrinibacteria bacterium]|nr:hypothetical protein [Candidatus Peregrinibacteria bacterium]MDZ4245272.1 hypothetical protein [Candidatus Gracilibacteria bacterium]